MGQSSNKNLLRENVFSDSEEVEEAEVVKVIKFLELFYQKTPEKFRQSLFGLSDNNTGGFTFLLRNGLENFKDQPELYKLFNDFIQKVDNDLNEHVSEKLIKEQAREDAEYIRKLKEQETGTPEKNDTTFWSEHKGKIALGVFGLCVVGAIAAYVLAYPVVALVLEVSAVSALAVLAYIGGVCEKSESPNTKSSDPVVSGCCNNAELSN
ncbi:hypothetical protein [Wolbachia endosymbiont (group A) of Gymnosoma rotundatum]|uniref:hypothetical protein n=1 Tax=Wolbachia endosymbiont (group A) of Gymnosoma rotundatum TaxID=2954016 RepID=UPI002226145B|nr:hypothetical protein [Wolbachia endosymbiont (group A) of Gymnosoma rotundatum]